MTDPHPRASLSHTVVLDADSGRDSGSVLFCFSQCSRQFYLLHIFVNWFSVFMQIANPLWEISLPLYFCMY